MSGSEISLKTFKVTDYVTAGNTIGLLYLYNMINTIGSNVNKSILKITQVIKILNKNINIVDSELKYEILNEINNPIHSNKNFNNNMDEVLSDSELIKKLISELKVLNDRITVIEEISNPITEKYKYPKCDISPITNEIHNNQKTAVL